MIRHYCADCGAAIVNGQARIRSRNFRQVALCAGCVGDRCEPQPIPSQRSGTHDDMPATTTVSPRSRG